MPTPVEQVERAMVRIRRNIARQAFGRVLAAELGEDVAYLGVVDALAEGAEATVGGVAERLAVDPSRASRLVAAAVDAGHVRRVASQDDGRRSELALTASGRKLFQRVRDRRQRWFSEAMADWTAEERATFARLLDRFVTELGG